MADEMGPVEYMVLAFPGNRFNGEIVPALAELVKTDTIRLIDLAFVKKDADGTVTIVELDDMKDDEAAGIGDFGAASDLLNEQDLLLAAEELEPNNSAAVLVWENSWAARFARAVRDADGIVVENGRVPHEIVQAATEYAAPSEG